MQKKGSHEYGKKHGEWAYWSLEGTQIKNGMYDKGKQTGEWRKFRNDGTLERIERYVDGLADGTWQGFHSDGTTCHWRREFARGTRNGKWESFYANGKPQLLETFKEDKHHGVSQSWDENGNLSGQGEFKNGRREGAFRSFQDGKLIEEEVWVDGKRKS